MVYTENDCARFSKVEGKKSARDIVVKFFQYIHTDAMKKSPFFGIIKRNKRVFLLMLCLLSVVIDSVVRSLTKI